MSRLENQTHSLWAWTLSLVATLALTEIALARPARLARPSPVVKTVQIALDELRQLGPEARRARPGCESFLKSLRSKMRWTQASGVVAFPDVASAVQARKVLDGFLGSPEAEVKRWAVLAGLEAVKVTIAPGQEPEILAAFQAVSTECGEDEIFEDLGVLVRETSRLGFSDSDRSAIATAAWRAIRLQAKGPANFDNTRRVVSLLFRMIDFNLVRLAPEALPRLKEIDTELVRAKASLPTPSQLGDLRREAGLSRGFLERVLALIETPAPRGENVR